MRGCRLILSLPLVDQAVFLYILIGINPSNPGVEYTHSGHYEIFNVITNKQSPFLNGYAYQSWMNGENDRHKNKNRFLRLGQRSNSALFINGQE